MRSVRNNAGGINSIFYRLALSLLVSSLLGCSLHQTSSTGRSLTTLNIDFGHWQEWGPSRKIGPAAVGEENDFWNVVAIPWNNDHTEGGLVDALKAKSEIQIRMVNLAGGWAQVGELGLSDPMLNTYNYPQNNRGGESQVEISHLQQGTYSLYIYGTSSYENFYGDYSVTVEDTNYGRKSTKAGPAAITAKDWTEGIQYVKFTGLKSPSNGKIKITIHEGKPFGVNGRTDTNTLICGLQLITEQR